MGSNSICPSPPSLPVRVAVQPAQAHISLRTQEVVLLRAQPLANAPQKLGRRLCREPPRRRPGRHSSLLPTRRPAPHMSQRPRPLQLPAPSFLFIAHVVILSAILCAVLAVNARGGGVPRAAECSPRGCAPRLAFAWATAAVDARRQNAPAGEREPPTAPQHSPHPAAPQ